MTTKTVTMEHRTHRFTTPAAVYSLCPARIGWRLEMTGRYVADWSRWSLRRKTALRKLHQEIGEAALANYVVTKDETRCGV